MKNETGRNCTIDLMKFAFTLLIMLYHTMRIFRGGYIAVEFFFLVSGYLMVKSMKRETHHAESLGRETIQFILHKALSIFPYFIIAWIFSFVITAFVQHYNFNKAVTELFLSPYNFLCLGMAGFYDMGHRVQASWYISAMLLAMFILFPIRKKLGDMYDFVIAPLLFLFFLGYCYQHKNGFSIMTVGYDNFFHVYNGLLRAIAEIAIGATCYRATKFLTNIEINKKQKCFITFLEWFGYIIAFYCAFWWSSSNKDFSIIFWLIISITISFSQKSFTANIFNNKSINFLGEFSLALYLMHEVVKNQFLKSLHLGSLPLIEYILIYFFVVFLFGMICYYGGRVLKKYIHSC